MHVRTTVLGNALGNSIIDGLTPKPQQFGPTREQMDDVYAQVDNDTRASMAETDALVQRDLQQQFEDAEFEHHIDVQGRVAARDPNADLAAKIQRSVTAPQFTFEPEIDAVAAAQARGRAYFDDQLARSLNTPSGAVSLIGGTLPEMDHSSYVAPGFVASSYYSAAAEAENSNNSFGTRAVNFGLAVAAAPLALVEETGRAILNIPYAAERMGQDLAIVNLSNDRDTQILASLDAVSFGAQAFTAAGSFVPVGGATSTLRTGMAPMQSTAEFAAARETYDFTTGYRVEGAPNTRMVIGDAGEVSISGDQTLFVNFGQPTRAEEFAARRISQGMEGVTIKEFSVPNSYVEQLRATAVFESEVHLFPDAPIRVDTRFPDQFGLRPQHFNELQNAIVPNSGKVRP